MNYNEYHPYTIATENHQEAEKLTSSAYNGNPETIIIRAGHHFIASIGYLIAAPITLFTGITIFPIGAIAMIAGFLADDSLFYRTGDQLCVEGLQQLGASLHSSLFTITCAAKTVIAPFFAATNQLWNEI